MAIVKGVDTVSNVTNILTQIKNKGYSYVNRYYSINGNSKRMGAAGAAEIANAGLKRVSVYQNLHNSYSKFSTAIAAGDATDAIAQAKSVGHSSGTIYFAVDYDASASEIEGNIKAHFNELKTMLSAAGYSLGVYGSSLVCKKLKEAGIVSKTWLYMSTGWGYNTNFNDWNMHQTIEVTFGGNFMRLKELESKMDGRLSLIINLPF